MNELALRELALFAGAGGGILGGLLLGWHTVAAVEIEDYPRRVLLQRQADGILSRFPIWDDVCTFDGKPWRGKVDVISGGFPCQDISAAGKGAGIEGERSGLWGEMARIIREVRPRFAFVENSPALTSRGLGVVLGDLAEMGYDARWCVLGADDVGAPHIRKRIWILATDSNSSIGRLQQEPGRETATDIRDDGEEESLANTEELRRDARRLPEREKEENSFSRLSGKDVAGVSSRRGWWETEPDVGRVADGVANRVDRLKALGNGQVPIVAATAWRLLNE